MYQILTNPINKYYYKINFYFDRLFNIFINKSNEIKMIIKY